MSNAVGDLGIMVVVLTLGFLLRRSIMVLSVSPIVSITYKLIVSITVICLFENIVHQDLFVEARYLVLA